MEHSPAAVIRQLLIDEGLFNDTLKAFVSNLPDSPDDAALITDTSGVKLRRKNTGENVLHYGLQIQIRTKDYKKGWTEAYTVQNHLSTVLNEPVDLDDKMYTVQSVTQEAPVHSLGQDDKRRAMFSINLLVFIEGGN